MSKSQAKIHIWNRALARIGESSVDSEEESTFRALQCRLHYDDIVMATLESAAWPFATQQSTINQVAGVTRTGWDYVYALPADCARPIALLGEDERLGQQTADARHPFAIQDSDDGESRYLLCDLDSDEIEALEYVAYKEDVGSFPRQFVECVAWALAAELALSIKKDPALHDKFVKLYGYSLSQAVSVDLNSERSDPEPDTAIIAAR